MCKIVNAFTNRSRKANVETRESYSVDIEVRLGPLDEHRKCSGRCSGLRRRLLLLLGGVWRNFDLIA